MTVAKDPAVSRRRQIDENRTVYAVVRESPEPEGGHRWKLVQIDVLGPSSVPPLNYGGSRVVEEGREPNFDRAKAVALAALRETAGLPLCRPAAPQRWGLSR